MSFARRPLRELLGKRGYIRGPFGSALKRKDLLTERGFPVYEQQHAIHGDRQFRYFIDDEKHRQLKRFETAPNDLIISCSGTVGRISVIQEEDPQGIISQALLILRPDTDEILPHFLYYFLISNEGYNSLIDASHGTVQSNIAKRSVVELIEVPSPSVHEQGKVVKILSSLDDKIALNRKLNATLEAMAQALFQSWFVDFDPVKAKLAAVRCGRDPEQAAMAAIACKLVVPPGKPKAETLDAQLPSAEAIDAAIAALDDLSEAQRQSLKEKAAHFPADFQESELGLIPQGWEVKALGDLINVLETGRRPKGGVGKYKEGIPSIGAESVQGIGNFDFSKTKFIPEEFFLKMKSGKAVSFDVLLYKDGGKPGEFKPRIGLFGLGYPFSDFAINEHVFRIRSECLGQPLLYFQLGSDRILEELANRGGKAAIPGVNQTEVKTLDFIRPSSGTISAFNQQAETLMESILKGFIQSRTLAELRDALLPKLLSGEISVNPN